MAASSVSFSVLLLSSDDASLPRIKKQLKEDSKRQNLLDTSLTLQDALEKLQKKSYNLILSEVRLPDGRNFRELLGELARKRISLPCVLWVSPGEEATARGALKEGVADFLLKNDEGFRDLPARLWSIYQDWKRTERAGDLGEEIRLQTEKLFEVNQKLRELSIRDPLTGVFNRRYFEEKLLVEFSRAVRYRHPLSCLLVDLDLFGEVNNRFGQSTGDEILKETANLLRETCRTSDLVGRYGGEAFAVLLPHVDYDGAREFAERVRELFAKHVFLGETGKISLTVSLGISCFPADVIKDRKDLLNFSGQALFRAKAQGRNQVILYRDILPIIGETLPEFKVSEEKILELQRKLSEVAEKARRSHIESTRTLMEALEETDHLTAGHSETVGGLAKQVAQMMGLSLDDVEVIEHAALLHDIGKLCISEQITKKPGELTLEEYEAIKQHPYFGYQILKPIKSLHEEAILILHHHEWFNGEGYPSRLSKHEIPIGSRIISVVDSYDTMRHTGRHYKQTRTVQEAADELIRSAGTQFDPDVVQAFIQVLLMRKELAADTYNKKLLEQAIETGSPHIA